MKNSKQKIEQIITVLDVVYENEIFNIQAKRNNLKSINLDTLTEHVELGFERGEFEQDYDLIKYIEAIIQD